MKAKILVLTAMTVEGVTLENVRADKVAEPDVVRNVKGFQKKEK